MSNIQRKADYTVKMAKQKLILELKNKNNKLQKALEIAMEAIEFGSKLNSYSDAVNTKYECNESKQKIQEILEG